MLRKALPIPVLLMMSLGMLASCGEIDHDEITLELAQADNDSGMAIHRARVETIYGPQVLTFVDQDGDAVFGMDMILGRTETILNEGALAENGAGVGESSEPLAASMFSLEGNHRRWDDGVIPYTIHSNARHYRSNILQAVQEWNSKTPIRWQPRTNEKDYVEFSEKLAQGQVCTAHLGRHGGKQGIFLVPRCNNQNSVLHEMGHALGFIHEHQRDDRNEYVQILWDKIDQQFGYAWRIHWERVKWHAPMSAYDFTSVMHYDGSFIQARPGYHPPHIGRGYKLSAKDVAGTWKLYGPQNGEVECPGSYKIDAAWQIESLAACSKIDGHLIIGRHFPKNSLNLPQLKEITGRLRVGRANSVSSIVLPALEKVGRGVYIDRNRNLVSVNLSALTNTRRISMRRNSALNNLDLHPGLNVRRVRMQDNGSLPDCRRASCLGQY